MARVIWDRSDNPRVYVSKLGIERWQLRAAIHKIKSAADVKADERVMLYDDRTVTDAGGDLIGNVYDEI